MSRELVGRLRSYRAYCPNTDRDDHPICNEAADAIERMSAPKSEVVGVDTWEGRPSDGPAEQRLRDQRAAPKSEAVDAQPRT